jgi:hypothetical protein
MLHRRLVSRSRHGGATGIESRIFDECLSVSECGRVVALVPMIAFRVISLGETRGISLGTDAAAVRPRPAGSRLRSTRRA